MPTFSAADIVGKTLIAKTKVAIKRQPSKAAPTVFTVSPGETVGVVYSWVNADGELWWMYYDNNKNPYYTQHGTGIYDIKSLNAQGTISLEQVQENTTKADTPVSYYLDKLTTPAVWGIGIYFAIKIYKELQ